MIKPSNPILQAENLTSGYTDIDIIHNVSIYLKEGEMVSIIGPNGAGKSTLIKTIFGLIKPRKGTVRLKGEEVTGLKPNELVKKGMSYVPQEKNIFSSLTVEENLEMGAYLRETGVKKRMKKVYERFPPLKEKRDQRVSKLSGGQRQMVALGRALMLDPDVLLLDEPSAGLAPTLVDNLFKRIIEINDRGTSIIMVEQNARRSLQISDRGYVLEMGKNSFEGKGEELLSNEEVEELYLGG